MTKLKIETRLEGKTIAIKISQILQIGFLKAYV